MDAVSDAGHPRVHPRAAAKQRQPPKQGDRRALIHTRRVVEIIQWNWKSWGELDTIPDTIPDTFPDTMGNIFGYIFGYMTMSF